ncbi:hypothetical protein DFH11DRAFT_1631930 [Phellopilus nigrolimitatus]|nr:hypothetical protein DFH11DRAFT_1631930 [Phellopilus nigrolimitatus]
MLFISPPNLLLAAVFASLAGRAHASPQSQSHSPAPECSNGTLNCCASIITPPDDSAPFGVGCAPVSLLLYGDARRCPGMLACCEDVNRAPVPFALFACGFSQ